MKRILFGIVAMMAASGCGGSPQTSEPSSKKPETQSAAAPSIADNKATPAQSVPSEISAPPKKNVDAPGLVLPEDDVAGGKGPELPIR
jgi:hypothetical protein